MSALNPHKEGKERVQRITMESELQTLAGKSHENLCSFCMWCHCVNLTHAGHRRMTHLPNIIDNKACYNQHSSNMLHLEKTSLVDPGFQKGGGVLMRNV